MKKIDFTKLGGLPFSQDRIDYLQNAYKEALAAIVGICSNVGPGQVVILSGMAVTTVGADVTVTDGWFIYNDEIIKFTGSTVTNAGSDVALIAITTNTTPLTYRNLTVRNVILDTVAGLTTGPYLIDAVTFPVSDVIQWVAIDPVLYADIATINADITTIIAELTGILGAWTQDLVIAIISTAGGGSFTGVTVEVSQFKRNGHTFHWMLRIKGTVAGTISSMRIKTPDNFYSGGGSWQVLDQIHAGVLNSAGTVVGLQVQQKDPGTGPEILCLPYAGNFSTGTNYLHVNLVSETT